MNGTSTYLNTLEMASMINSHNRYLTDLRGGGTLAAVQIGLLGISILWSSDESYLIDRIGYLHLLINTQTRACIKFELDQAGVDALLEV